MDVLTIVVVSSLLVLGVSAGFGGGYWRGLRRGEENAVTRLDPLLRGWKVRYEQEQRRADEAVRNALGHRVNMHLVEARAEALEERLRGLQKLVASGSLPGTRAVAGVGARARIEACLN